MQDPLPSHGTCPIPPPAKRLHPPASTTTLPNGHCSPSELCPHPPPRAPLLGCPCAAPAEAQGQSGDIPIPALLPVWRLLLLVLQLLLPAEGLRAERGDVSNEVQG